MIFEIEEWDEAYRNLVRDIRTKSSDPSVSSSVLILCNMDTDALCAARIIAYLLRADNITYQLRPCPSNASLVRIISSLKQDEEEAPHNIMSQNEIGAIVLLNIGGMYNLTRFYDDRGGNDDDDDDDMDSSDDETSIHEKQKTSLLSLSTKMFVMDCHRPWHLANIHAGENITLFKEEALEDDVPSDGDGLSGDESSSDEESSDEDEDSEDDSDDDDQSRQDDDEGEHEFEFDRDENVSRSDGESLSKEENKEREPLDDETSVSSQSSITGKKRKRKNKDNAESYDTEEEEDDDIRKHPTVSPSKEQNQPETAPPSTAMSFRDLHRARRDRISAYYFSGTYHRAPVSWIAYTLSHKLSRFGNLGDLLWLACVGITDALLHNRLDADGYSLFVTDLQRHVSRIYPNDDLSRAQNTIHSNLVSDEDDLRPTQIGVSENGRILCQTEFRFMLLRHTNLLDAMLYSNYVGTRLKVWKEQGRFQLSEMLAKMGFPLEECKQPWAFMNPKLKRILKESMVDHKEDFGLDNIDFYGFIRVSGYKSLISASDMSYAVTALLESGQMENNTSGNLLTSVQNEDIQSFNMAYDALNAKSTGNMIHSEGSNLSNLVNGGEMSGSQGLGAGIRLAVQQQKNILSTAIALVEKNAIIRLKHFRYAYLNGSDSLSSYSNNNSNQNRGVNVVSDSSSSSNSFFTRPLGLIRLANYLMDMHQDKWTHKNARPLIILSEKPHTNTFLIAGYYFPVSKDDEDDEDIQDQNDLGRNKFKKYFELTAKSMEGVLNCRIQLDSTSDGNVIEVDRGGEQRFIEQLHYVMDAVQRAD